MTSNNQSNQVIKWAVVVSDFVILNIILLLFIDYTTFLDGWESMGVKMYIAISNLALVLSEWAFSTIVHNRMVSAGDILKRVVQLTVTQAVLSYVLLKVMDVWIPVGWKTFLVGTVLFVVIILSRIAERLIVKNYRMSGKNTRYALFVGNDPELEHIYKKLMGDPTSGYLVKGYYANASMGEWTHSMESGQGQPESEQVQIENEEVKEIPLEKLGSLDDLVDRLEKSTQRMDIDEMYVCLSRRDKKLIQTLSRLCDQHMVRFFYVPVSVESVGINFRREMLDDIEIYTTYENPLANPINKAIKRAFDIVFSIAFLIPTAILLPWIYYKIKRQSPGPILFKQERTGIDGKTFKCYKFRSMHINKDADKLQATENDPRKFPFGDFMRKANLDELPQFFNVLQGRMSIVGPRPHMLKHTEEYSEQIGKYMVRHYVKPGITGWAQVTGYRGETKKLWQMEERVRRDIWYIEHWSIWLDFRIMWLTGKSIFIHDKNAY